METIASVLYTLARSGYKAYISINPKEPGLVIEDRDTRLAKILYRRATKTDKTPILTLSNLQKSKTFLQNYGYILVTEPTDLVSWLIPIEIFPTDCRTVRLGEKYHQYLLQPIEREQKLLSKTIRAQVQERIKDSIELDENQITNLFNEDLE